MDDIDRLIQEFNWHDDRRTRQDIMTCVLCGMCTCAGLAAFLDFFGVVFPWN